LPHSDEPSWSQSADWTELISRAKAVRQHAYCPYSGYAVGAALLDDRRKLFAGCNVENVSFGATLCAERSAVAAMVADGGRALSKMAIATADGGSPCGICLQVLLEFSKPAEGELEIALVSETGSEIFSFSTLLPFPFLTFYTASVRDGSSG
jgi:cytidine deaminase